MRWYLRPRNLTTAFREGRRVRAGGGPKEVTVTKVGEPEGWLLPTARVGIDVVAKDGTKSSFEPVVPVPWPAALAYRTARLLKVPVIRDFEPEGVGFTLRWPGA